MLWCPLMIQAKPTIVELSMDKLEEILRRLEAKELGADDYETIKAVIGSYVYLVNVVGDKDTTIRRLRQMLFGAKTEKTSAVIGGVKGAEGGAASPGAEAVPDSPTGTMQSMVAEAEASAKADAEVPPEARTESDSQTSNEGSGHGRNGADAFTGAEKIEVRHESLQAGDPCPKCEQGTLYDTRRPGVLVRLVGQAPVKAMVYYLQKLRCNPCGALFAAKPPKGVDPEEKYDPTVGSMIALLKYGNGMPFHRQETLQGNLGIPLSDSTQWDIVDAQAERAEPIWKELVRQAAQGDVVHNDDTGVKILELMGERARQAALENTDDDTAEDSAEDSAKELGPERTGMFTTGIVATGDGHKIALFLSGRQHAGENLKDVLRRRAAELPPPIQMSDALSRNLPGELKTIVANCLAHGRRQFHQRRVEPNSGLGKAISYLLRHWDKLTLFLRVAGAPLDNNICERALKKAIRHRRNSLFYKTPHGAHVGDIFMSLIATCELCGANPFDYLTELDRHASEPASNPTAWMPWSYRETLAGLASPPGTAS